MLSEIWRRIEGIESKLEEIKQLLLKLDTHEIKASKKRLRAVAKWLEFLEEVKGKWAPDSPSAVEISRMSRRHGRTS